MGREQLKLLNRVPELLMQEAVEAVPVCDTPSDLGRTQDESCLPHLHRQSHCHPELREFLADGHHLLPRPSELPLAEHARLDS